MKDIVTFNELMIYYLQTLLDTEMKWSAAIEQVYDKISSHELKELFFRSDELSRNHLRIISEILEELKASQSFAKENLARGIIDEMFDIIQTAVDPEVRDSALLVFHQCMNHYKIARYGTVSSYATLLGEEKVAGSIHHLLVEEKGADEALTKLAESKINPQAQSPSLM